MFYLLCKHKVSDFTTWHRIFQSHAEAHRKAGLHLLYLLRDTTDSNFVLINRFPFLQPQKETGTCVKAHQVIWVIK